MTLWLPRSIRSAGRLLRSRDARRNTLHEWQRRLQGPPALPAGKLRSVLILCQGNICRSPFAAVALANRRPELAASSAGLAAGHGLPADPTATRVARRFGLDLSAHRSRSFDEAALAEADLVLVMEAAQAAALRARAPTAADRTFLLGDFLDRGPFGIADPFGHPEPVFVTTFEQIVAAVDALGRRLEEARP